MVLDKLPPKRPVMGVDLEGSWSHNPSQRYLSLVQMAVDEETYILTRDFQQAKGLLEDPNILKILHNAAFDARFLLAYGIRLQNVYDTMLAEAVLQAGLAPLSGLDSLVGKYLGGQLDKSLRESFLKTREITPEMLAYAARDAEVLIPIYRAQIQVVQEQGLAPTVDLESRLAPVVGAMEYVGIGFSQERWNALLGELTPEAVSLSGEIFRELGVARQLDLFGDVGAGGCNLNSGPQVLAALRKVGIDLPNYQEHTLRSYLQKHPGATVIVLLLRYKELCKCISWDYPKYLAGGTGRIHPEYHQLGARTGRFSSSHPNLQNVPTEPEFRRLFIPAAGCLFVRGDYSQIELRVLAELSRDENMCAAFREGRDIHQETAQRIQEILGYPVSRAVGKSANFAAVYGGGAEAFAETSGLPVRESRGVLKALFMAFPGVAEWRRAVYKDYLLEGYTTTLLGRRRWLPRAENPDKYRNAVCNAPVQGSAGDILKLAMVYLDERLQGYDARIVNTVHDELVVEVAERQASQVADLVKQAMIQAGAYFLTAPVEVEVSIGKDWSVK